MDSYPRDLHDLRQLLESMVLVHGPSYLLNNSLLSNSSNSNEFWSLNPRWSEWESHSGTTSYLSLLHWIHKASSINLRIDFQIPFQINLLIHLLLFDPKGFNCNGGWKDDKNHYLLLTSEDGTNKYCLTYQGAHQLSKYEHRPYWNQDHLFVSLNGISCHRSVHHSSKFAYFNGQNLATNHYRHSHGSINFELIRQSKLKICKCSNGAAWMKWLGSIANCWIRFGGLEKHFDDSPQ